MKTLLMNRMACLTERGVLGHSSRSWIIFFYTLIIFHFSGPDSAAATVNITLRYKNDSVNSVKLVYKYYNGSTWSSNILVSDSLISGGSGSISLSGITVGWQYKFVFGAAFGTPTTDVGTTDNLFYWDVPSGGGNSPYFVVPGSIAVSTSDQDATESSSFPANTWEIGKFTVTRTGSTASDLVVYFSMSGNAIYSPSLDYSLRLGGSWLGSSYFTIPSGNSSVDIELHAWSDGIGDDLQNAYLNLSTHASYVVGSPSVSDAVLIHE